MRAVWLVVVLLLSGCASYDEWRTQDTVLLATAMTVTATDWYMTRQIGDYPTIYERGPIAKHVLGTQPTDRDSALYFGSILISQYFIARALPHKWRSAYLGFEIVTHGIGVRHSCQTPIC